MDPDLRIRILFLSPVAFLMPTKKKSFCLLLLLRQSSRRQVIKTSKNVEVKVFLNFFKVFLHFFACWWKDPIAEPRETQKHSDPTDPDLEHCVFEETGHCPLSSLLFSSNKDMLVAYAI